MSASIGDDFQRATKYVRGKLGGGYLDWPKKPETYKCYVDSKRIQLPLLEQAEIMSVEEALKRRRSICAFSGKPLTLEQLSYRLWASTVFRGKRACMNFALRSLQEHYIQFKHT
jgi:hypothetical protein